jgi:hypothetical protein
MGRKAGRKLLNFRRASFRGLFRYRAKASRTNPATLTFLFVASPRNTSNCAGSNRIWVRIM